MKVKRIIEDEVDTLPCPFCGGEDIHYNHVQPCGYGYLYCFTCKSKGPSTEENYTINPRRQMDAIELWNRRGK